MNYDIVTEELPRQPYAAVRATVRMERIGESMGPLFGRLYGSLGAAALSPAGEPWTRYLIVGKDECELELAVPIASEPDPVAAITFGVRPACTVARTLHIGAYAELGAAYAAIGAWVATNGAQVTGAMWESYLNSPPEVPAERLETLVFYPVHLA